jgi:gamma-glutamyltranspeptidase / glutathione hydrolase
MGHVAVAAPSPAAAQAAAKVMDLGGGPVDAAIAAAVAAMVSEPGVVAPGAGAFVTVWAASGPPVVYDGYMAVPGLGGRNPEPAEHMVSMEYGGGITTAVGPASVAVPGAWAAFGLAHEEHGSLPWREVIAPAIDLATTGTPLGPTSALYLDYSLVPVFDLDPVGSRALRRGGRPLGVGDSVLVEGLAASLERLASHGADEFYRGDLGYSIASDLWDRGSHLGPEDLRTFRAERRTPLGMQMGSWTLATNPPPAVGGAALAALLALSPTGEPAELIAAQRLVLGWRRGELSDDRNTAIRDFLASLPGDPIRSASTAHVSAAGNDTVCAVTLSAGYGSGVIPAGTGMWMNNGLGNSSWWGTAAACGPAIGSTRTWRRLLEDTPTDGHWPSGPREPTESRAPSPRR